MSFDLVERSQESGIPVELYEFRYGPGDDNVYRYTNADAGVGHDGESYIALPIMRERYSSSGAMEKSALKITIPVDSDISDIFREYPPTQPVTLVIKQGHFGDPDNDFLAVWSGRVLSVAKEGRENVLTCESTIISLKRPGLRRNYQYACPYVLYSRACGADKAAARIPTTVDSLDGGRIQLAPGWNGDFEPKRFSGGMLEWSTPKGLEVRTILKVDEAAQTITVIGPFRGLAEGDPITAIVGCNHLVDGCEIHDNIVNYGGQPWIPLKNPVRHHPFW